MRNEKFLVAVFHGSPRKGNTYKAAKIFMDELEKRSNVSFEEFFLPDAIPKFCTGCQLCLGGDRAFCPHAEFTDSIYAAIMSADALIFATPHWGASTISSPMKNLLDHLDFFTMTVAPRKEIFRKKAFIIATGTGSTSAISPIKKCLKNWGINRVNSLGIRMFTDKWDKMPPAKAQRLEKKLRKSANKLFYDAPRRPYLSTIFMYHMSKIIIKRYIGEDAYPYKYWMENNFFKSKPFYSEKHP